MIQKLLEQIEQSPSCYHATDTVRRQLLAAGYHELSEMERWSLRRGGRYFVLRGDASLIAFRLPVTGDGGFMLAAAHSDSPTFQVKEHAEKRGEAYVQLNTEKYGGMLMASWFDRPLSVAGRIFVQENGTLSSKLVQLDRDLLIIPSVAIHLNRNANEGFAYRANIDTLPLYGDKGSPDLMDLVAQSADVPRETIWGSDLFLYCRQKGTLLGANEEYLAAPKLDDLECAFGCLEGFLTAEESQSIPVYCLFHNEEVGSATRQGAGSSFLRDVLRRISLTLENAEEAYQMRLARSFLVSADNAHAKHPNHPEYADSDNCPYLNRGLVIKFNANQRYATDGYSSAFFRKLCAEASVPVQVMSNRSDLVGGSTLGSIASTLLPVPTVDIGLPQLAMHSVYETAGARDYAYLVQAMTHYFSAER